jgi:quinol monooxygenase YgiN
MSVLKESIAVFADIRAKPGCESELRDTFSAATERNRGNDAAILYRLHVDVADHAHLVFYEIWRDSAAIDAYQSSPSFKAMLDQAMPATESVNIYRLRAIAE